MTVITKRDSLQVDAIATARFDAQTGADREVQRILMELLNQMDGFDQTVNVKVIMATNRHDTLDPALMRPGRLDRKIEFPLPDRRQKRLIFQACASYSSVLSFCVGNCLQWQLLCLPVAASNASAGYRFLRLVRAVQGQVLHPCIAGPLRSWAVIQVVPASRASAADARVAECAGVHKQDEPE